MALDSVLRYREHLLSQRQAALAEVLAVDGQLAEAERAATARREAVSAEAAAVGAVGRIDVSALSSRLLYSGLQQSEAVAIAQQRSLLAEEVAVRRRAVAKAEADVRAIERVIEQRAEAAKKVADRKAQLTLEDGWLTRQLRR